MNKSKVIRFAVIGIVLTTLVSTISRCTGVDEGSIQDIIDEIQRKYFPQTELNEYIIKDDKLLQRRISRDVDKAIRDYERLTGDDGTVKLPPPRYSEKPVDTDVCYTDECRSLGGEMRLCSPWALDCPPGDVVR
ncbi:MAG: hypothetical protein ACO236_07750 [Candidatus Nanopelagicaceae bacterium]